MTTEAGTRLTTAHRLAQLRIGVQTVAAMRAIWPLLDIEDLDGSFERWLLTAAPVIDAHRANSSRLAAAYVTAFRRTEVGSAVGPVLAASAPPQAVATSLLVTGPISIRKALTRGVPLVRALSVAEVASSASAMRHALNGGRDTIRTTLATDRDAEGWRRVTSGNACRFCSMLAGRGAVYDAHTSDFHAHDGCSCSAEPVYR